MDAVDQKLLSALRHDARASLSELAMTLGVSRTTVRSRIDRLKASGQIVGFTVVLKEDTIRDPVRGLMMLGIEGRGTERVERRLRGLSSVRALHSTNGRWDLIVEIGAETLEDLDAVLAEIRRFEGVATSETSLLLSTKKQAG
ncbi:MULTISPECIES: Lrp/AsnC family transcriptional regulator [unclassified Roseovarius]|uniref:Lrp/AsnC family transcriptional regulator n=1 Tax=unclassified Roseovarius TaxID=2614913 RepID=UPI00273E3699|nr:Lrp/AsnC family transcriptional regulator [Roseovarius sp. MMSF_3350]